jgi:putative phosphatase
MTQNPTTDQSTPRPQPEERLRILAEEYESKGQEAQGIRERMIRLVGVAVLVMGVIASIPGVSAVDVVTKSTLFWWCAPALLAALFAAFVLDYAVLNGIVYCRRDLEDEINTTLGRGLVLHFENGFGRQFFSLRTGDTAMRVIMLALLLGIAGIYIGSVALSLNGLKIAYQATSEVVLPTESKLFIGTYATLGLFLAYAAFRAAFRMEALYKKAKDDYERKRSGSPAPRTKSAIPWLTLLVPRPWEIPTKSLFFLGAYLFGFLYTGLAHWIDALVVWVCLELMVNQAKYVMNDIYDKDADSRYHDVRENLFQGLSKTQLYICAAAAIAKACIGSLFAYWWLGKDIPTAMAIFLLLPMQMLYNKARGGSPADLVKKWLHDFREKNRLTDECTRDKAVISVKDKGFKDFPQMSQGEWGRRGTRWSIRTVSLGLLLGAGYAIRLGIPLHLTGISADPLLFAGYLTWGTAFGFAFILGYWSWEGAWYAQRPLRFKKDQESVTTSEEKNEESYIEDVTRWKAHTLWCFIRLVEYKKKYLPTPWTVVWSVVLLAGAALGACTLRHFLNWRGSWVLPLAVGLLSTVAYLVPALTGQLNRLASVFTASLLLCLGAIAIGYRPTNLALPYVFLPSAFALLVSAHYTAGPWSNFDQKYVTGKIHKLLTDTQKKLVEFLDSLVLSKEKQLTPSEEALVCLREPIENVYNLQPDRLRRAGIKGVLIDLENTLIPYGATSLTVEGKEMLKRLVDSRLTVLVASNTAWSPAAEDLPEGISYQFRSWKPFSFRLSTWFRANNLRGPDTLVIGDQVLTDGFLAVFRRSHLILITPLSTNEPAWARTQRLIGRLLEPLLIRIRHRIDRE